VEGSIAVHNYLRSRPSLFWDFTQRVLVPDYRRFGTAYRPR